ncbi:MAG TPA: acyl-CoA carboxylase subunit epsilon [Nitriliruptorales bacterium]
MSPARIEIVGGGEPTPEELAALTVALVSVAAEQPVDDDIARASWERAALLEGVGFRPFASYTDLDRYHRSIA